MANNCKQCSIRIISHITTPLPKSYDCVAVYIAGRRTSLVVYGWWPQPPTKNTTSSKSVTNSRRKWGCPIPKYITVTSWSARWRLKSPASRLFPQPFIQGADQREHQTASLAFVRGIHRWPVNSPHKRPVVRKMFLFWWRHHGPQWPDRNTGHPLTNWQWAIQWHTPLHSISRIKTHWGRATHICVSEIIIIGSDNGLSPGRRQAIFWTNVGILLIGPLGINFSEILIEINTFSFKKMYLKISSAKWRLFRIGLNVLRLSSHTKTHIGHWAIRSYWYKWSFHSVWRFPLKEASEHKILNFR